MLFAVIVFFIFELFALADGIRNKCSATSDELNCIVNEYNIEESRFYSGSGYKYLYEVLHKEYERAIGCANIKVTARYIRNLSRFNTMGTELYEDSSEGIETMCTLKPDCFVEAMLLVDENVRCKIENRFLRAPTFYSGENIESCYFAKIGSSNSTRIRSDIW
jgi:hypothetical protein